MKTGELVFRKSLPACFFLLANGPAHPRTLKTSFRKLSSGFWRKQHKIDNPERIGARELIRSRALLYATVRSIALDSIRRNTRRERREAAALAEADQSVQPSFEIENESEQSLAAAIALLPDEQREVLVMKIWNDLTFAEIASVLGISQNTAASRYRYALAALKKNFGPAMNDFSELEHQLRKLRPVHRLKVFWHGSNAAWRRYKTMASRW